MTVRDMMRAYRHAGGKGKAAAAPRATGLISVAARASAVAMRRIIAMTMTKKTTAPAGLFGMGKR